jgi:hypothetical protein
MKKIALAFAAILTFVTSVSAVSLFEIKDESGNPVLVVSSDGLRILNGADTLMVISTEGIKAFIETDPAKGKARTFSVSSGTNSGDVLNVTKDGMRIYDQTDDSKALGDTLMTISSRSIKAFVNNTGKALSRTFAVTTTSSKSTTNVFEVGTERSSMTQGATGEDYTNFSAGNIFLGLSSGSSNTTGLGNTYMGNYSGMSNEGGNNNVMIGEAAGKYYSGSFGNVFIGQEAAENLTTGQRNVMIGYNAGSEPLNTFESYGNVFIGGVAGKKISGNYNVMIGEAAGENYQTGGATAAYNVFVGNCAGQHITGNRNIAIGYQAGVGESTNVNPGSGNIMIGPYAGSTEKGSYKFIVGSEYGDLMYGNLNSPRRLVVAGNESDNPNGRTFYVNGSAGGDYPWYNDSDERLKKNIRTIEGGLEKVMKLRGVTYEWKDENSLEKGKRMGFIAQESKDIIPEAVDYNSANDRYTMQYSTITAVLVEAVKELKVQLTNSLSSFSSQNERIDILMKENNELKKKVSELEELRAEVDMIKKHISNYAVK